MTSLLEPAFTVLPQLGASTLAVLLATLSQRLVPDGRLRTRRLCNLALAAVLALVWIGELQSLLLSLTAVAMALVLATKELIQCATGSLAARAGRAYAIGDRVCLDGTAGRVVAMNVLTTTIAETDGRALGSRPTGRRLVVPNSRIFGGGIHVEEARTAAPFRHHAFAVTLETGAALRETLALAEGEAAACTAPGAPGPRVALATTDLGKPRLDVVLFCAPEALFAAERQVTLAVLERQGGERPARANLALVRDRAA